jgi:hypothetical protein
MPTSVTPTISLDSLLAGLELGDHDEALVRAYGLALATSRAGQAQLVADVLDRMRATGDHEDVHIESTAIEGIARIDPMLVPVAAIEELANSEETSRRMAAIVLLWELAEAAPGMVPLGILGRLARPSDEDWYVEAPAIAVTKLLMLRRRPARVIFDRLAGSPKPTDRYQVAGALLDLAGVDAKAVPPDLVRRLVEDADELVATKAQQVLEAISHLDEHAYERRFSPFGI